MDPSYILSHELFSLNDDLSYEDVLVGIVDWKSRLLRNKEILFVKVVWQNHAKEEATWELESDFRV